MARDPYEVVLADLRAKRDDIDKLIRTLESYRPAQASGVASPSAERVSLDGGGPLYGLSIVEASKIVLRGRGRSLPVSEIVAGLQAGGHVMNSEDPSNTVSSVLNRAFQKGEGVVRVGRGTWALAPEPEPKTVEEQAAQGQIEAMRAQQATAQEPTVTDIDDDIPF